MRNIRLPTLTIQHHSPATNRITGVPMRPQIHRVGRHPLVSKLRTARSLKIETHIAQTDTLATKHSQHGHLAMKHESGATRSEEHTSELQSRQYLVCRLLLEKKKKNTNKSTLVIHISSYIGHKYTYNKDNI